MPSVTTELCSAKSTATFWTDKSSSRSKVKSRSLAAPPLAIYVRVEAGRVDSNPLIAVRTVISMHHKEASTLLPDKEITVPQEYAACLNSEHTLFVYNIL